MFKNVLKFVIFLCRNRKRYDLLRFGRPEFLDKISSDNTKSYFPHSEKFIKALRKENYKGKIFLTALNEKDLENLKDSSAGSILFPHYLAGVNFYNAYLLDSFRQKGDKYFPII